MSCRLLWLGVLAAYCFSPLAAKIYYVGTCQAGGLATIGAAVSSPQVAPGSIVKVCPNNYFEQVMEENTNMRKSILLVIVLDGGAGFGSIFRIPARGRKEAVAFIAFGTNRQ